MRASKHASGFFGFQTVSIPLPSAGCRQRSRRQDYRLHLRRTGQPDLPPAARRRKPILPIRFRKPTRPRRNQKARQQYRNLDIRLRPVRTPPLQRTPRQTRLDEHRPQKHSLRLGRQPPIAGVHLQRQLHLYLHRPRQLRTPGTSLLQQSRRGAIPRLFPHRPSRYTEGDDRHSW